LDLLVLSCFQFNMLDWEWYIMIYIYIWPIGVTWWTFWRLPIARLLLPVSATLRATKLHRDFKGSSSQVGWETHKKNMCTKLHKYVFICL
jgi:hypothetical protein